VRSLTEAFLSGEIGPDELEAALKRAAQVREATARGEDRLPDGTYIKTFYAVAGPDGTATISIGEEE